MSGELSISFYDIEAGTKVLEPIKIPPRSSPQFTEVDVDASNLPTGRVPKAAEVSHLGQNPFRDHPSFSESTSTRSS